MANKNQPVKICTYDEQGNEHTYEINPRVVGQFLINLERIKELLGHTTITSTIRYVHGLENIPEYVFVRDIILRERGKLK